MFQKEREILNALKEALELQEESATVFDEKRGIIGRPIPEIERIIAEYEKEFDEAEERYADDIEQEELNK